MTQLSLLKAVDTVLEAASSLSITVYVVGGVVRDLLLGISGGQYDIDILVDGPSEPVARKVCDLVGGKLTVHERFLTAKVLLDAHDASMSEQSSRNISEIDFAAARVELYDQPAALPRVELASLAQDLKRRDFTINAMALPLHKYREAILGELSADSLSSQVVDPFNGQSDLQSKLIRVLHERSFRDDPTRMIRALRYMVRLEGGVEMQTRALFQDGIDQKLLDRLSFQRYMRELLLVLEEERAAPILQEMLQFRIAYKSFVGETVLALLIKGLTAADTLQLNKSPRLDRLRIRRDLFLATMMKALPSKEFKSIPVSAAERKSVEKLLDRAPATDDEIERERVLHIVQEAQK